ncbi:MAG: LysR family transcriptional regulator [Glaciihabitans sp.]|jgi:DNA-binding transcriptional LysR family regulator|nr:LysR family transcriptional regulator [Glaciihabitans sp.]
MDDMDLEHLRWFQAVADGDTVTDTAAAAFMTQPAMSRALARLEKEVGADLFFRSGRGLKITPAGRVFKPFADEILDRYDGGLRSVAHLMSPDTGTVPIAFLHTLGTWFVPQLLSGFHRKHPRVEFELQQRGEAGLREELLAGSADVIITSESPTEPDVAWQQLLVEPLALAVPPGHRLANRKRVRLSEAAGDSFIVLGRGYGLRQITERLCREAGFNPRIGFEGEEVETLRGLVSAGLGVSLLPDPAAPGARLGDSSLLLPITDVRAERTIGIAWLAKRELPGPSAAFRDYVIAEGARVSK